MRRLMLAAVLSAASSAAVQAQTVATGAYECWYFTRAQPGLNFNITGPGTFTDVEGKRGTFTVGTDNRMTFKGGAHEGSRAVYKPLKTPTVSFIGNSGAEAAFCELAK
jgi:hypothetical protein